MQRITLHDYPCGWGKTTDLLNSLSPDKKYIVVVPSLDETERVQEGAARVGVTLERPGFAGESEVCITKGKHLLDLLAAGRSVVCTHELIYRLGSAASLQTHTLRGSCSIISEYELIIDEVLNPFESITSPNVDEFRRDYVELGLATVDDDGLVRPTAAWDERVEQGSKTFDPELYNKAKSGALRKTCDGLLLATFPLSLLTAPRTTKIMTFCSEGSYLRCFLNKLLREGADFDLEVHSILREHLLSWKQEVVRALTLRSIPAFEKLNLSYSGQTNFRRASERREVSRKASTALSNLRQRDPELSSIVLNEVILTCAREDWIGRPKNKKPEPGPRSKNSRIFGRSQRNSDTGWTTNGVRWLSNMTRGTNLFSDCRCAIYLYNQHPNPSIVNFLFQGVPASERRRFEEQYAVAELIQWLFRTRIRRGGLGLLQDGTAGQRGPRMPVTLYLPSARMRRLLTEWLEGPA